MTEGKFKAIKVLLKSGATQQEVADTFEVSINVVRCCKNSETFEEYRHKMYVMYSSSYRRKKNAELKKQEEERVAAEAKAAEEAKKQEAEKPEPVREKAAVPQMMASSYQVNRMIELMQQQHELLKFISNKLAFIVEELTGK